MTTDSNHLKLKEKEGMYPPHFQVGIDGTQTIKKATAHITFSGGTASDIVFDIHLIPSNKGLQALDVVVPTH